LYNYSFKLLQEDFYLLRIFLKIFSWSVSKLPSAIMVTLLVICVCTGLAI
jgi:hypothetical protein